MPEGQPKRLAMIVSGEASTAWKISQECQPGARLHEKILPSVVVVTNETAGALKRNWLSLGVNVEILPRKNFLKGEEGVQPYGQALMGVLDRYEPDVVTLNGCLVKISEQAIEETQADWLNQHPGHPKWFGGKDMWGKRVHATVVLFSHALKREDRGTIVVAQRVDPHYDRGKIVKWASVPIFRADNPHNLQERALPVEYGVQIDVLEDVAYERVQEQNPQYGIVNSWSASDRLACWAAKKVAIYMYPKG